MDATAGRLYRFDDALSVGYMMDSAIRQWEPLDQNPFRNQQDFLRAGGVTADIYQSLTLYDPLDPTLREEQPDGAEGVTFEGLDESPIGTPPGVGEPGMLDSGYSYTRPAGRDIWEQTVRLVVPEDQHVYLYFNPNKRANFVVKVHAAGADINDEGTEIKRVDINEQELVDAGFRQAGEIISIKMKAESDGATDIRAYAVGLVETAYRQSVEELKTSQLQVTSFNNHIEGEITAAEAGDLFNHSP